MTTIMGTILEFHLKCLGGHFVSHDLESGWDQEESVNCTYLHIKIHPVLPNIDGDIM